MAVTMQHKTFNFQVKAVGITTSDDGQELGQIEAYGSVFDVVDQGDGYYQDVVRKGAFTRTINNSKARIQAGKASFLATMLWSHDPQNHLPIGGWYDLKEDQHGLLGHGQIVLATQLGREVYELIKAKVINQFSIGYDIPNKDGSRINKDGNRELTEIRLWEISPVVFAMNEEALLVSVKSLEQKSVCGNTSGPIGPRDEAWDGSAAEKWIWGQALGDDDEVKPAVAKKYFMCLDGDPKLKGSYGYPFWINDHISVGGVKAIAGALSGARNADAGGDSTGLKSKIETLYAKINKKYPDATPLTPPWQDDGKGNAMTLQTKTLMEHYNQEMAADLLEDWQDVYLCALSCAVYDAFKIGDQPAQDISEALDAFKDLVLSKFVAQAEECGLSEYLEAQSYTSSPGEYLMQYGSDSKPNYGGYMSSNNPLIHKAGRPLSAENQNHIDAHAKALHDIADKAMATMKEHTKALHQAADEFKAAFGSPEKRAEFLLSLKAGRAVSAATQQAISDHVDSVKALAATMKKDMNLHTKAVHTVADDLASVLQGAESAYSTDSGDAGDRQEGKSASHAHARAADEHSSGPDDVSEDEITAALVRLGEMRTPTPTH